MPVRVEGPRRYTLFGCPTLNDSICRAGRLCLLGIAAVLEWRQRPKSGVFAICGVLLLWLFYGRFLPGIWVLVISYPHNLDFIPGRPSASVVKLSCSGSPPQC
jgi:hypothetical protein